MRLFFRPLFTLDQTFTFKSEYDSSKIVFFGKIRMVKFYFRNVFNYACIVSYRCMYNINMLNQEKPKYVSNNCISRDGKLFQHF